MSLLSSVPGPFFLLAALVVVGIVVAIRRSKMGIYAGNKEFVVSGISTWEEFLKANFSSVPDVKFTLDTDEKARQRQATKFFQLDGDANQVLIDLLTGMMDKQPDYNALMGKIILNAAPFDSVLLKARETVKGRELLKWMLAQFPMMEKEIRHAIANPIHPLGDGPSKDQDASKKRRGGFGD